MPASTSPAWLTGQRVSTTSIPQLCLIAQQFGPEEKLFWYAFFTGLTGAACAGIGMPALLEMFAALQQTFADAELDIAIAEQQPTH